MANSVDPDQLLHSAASDLGLHCLLKPVCPIFKVIMVPTGIISAFCTKMYLMSTCMNYLFKAYLVNSHWNCTLITYMIWCRNNQKYFLNILFIWSYSSFVLSCPLFAPLRRTVEKAIFYYANSILGQLTYFVWLWSLLIKMETL